MVICFYCSLVCPKTI